MLQKIMDGTEVSLLDDDRVQTVNYRQIMIGFKTMLEKFEMRTYAMCENATERLSGSLVRACPNDVRNGFKSFKYRKWFQRSEDDLLPITSYLQDVDDIRVMARFRCGMHWLATEKQRSNEAGRSGRICGCCNRNEREDELHVLFCDAYTHIRQHFHNVFTSESYKKLHDAYMNNNNMIDVHMNEFMNQDDVRFVTNFAGYLRRSIKVRDDLLATRT
jgi:hypothetical protein